MAIFNFKKTYSEFSRMWAVNTVFMELIMDGLISHLYRGKGLAKRSIPKRIFASVIRRMFRRDRGQVPFPIAFRKALERLGPTYVKFGQILSLRSDFLPERITNELRKLQTQVPPIPFAAVKKVVEQEFNLPLSMIFKDFSEEPLASASLAQTHMATLKNGTRVVVKVQKPGIVSIISNDIAIMRRIARWANRIPRLRDYNPVNMIDEFASYTFRELDFRSEGKNADKFNTNFKDWPDVFFPNIFWDYTTTKVLTMEYIAGVKPDDEETLKNLEVDTHAIAVRGLHAILKMLYIDGFFHGDPHPGNLFVVNRKNIAFIDLGMIGSFSKEVKRNMFLYFFNMVVREFENATKYLMSLCTINKDSDEAGFRKELFQKISHWANAGGFNEYSLGHLILETMNIGARYKMYFHRDLVLMSKCIITIEAVGNILDPKLDVPKEAEPFMQEVFLAQFSPVKIAKQFLNSVPDYLRFMENLPSTGLDLFENIQKGVLHVKVEEDEFNGSPLLLQGRGKSSNQRNYSVLAVSTLAIGALFTFSNNVPGGYIESIQGLEDLPLITGILFLSSIFFTALTFFSGKKS